jgi:hypothetical protein
MDPFVIALLGFSEKKNLFTMTPVDRRVMSTRRTIDWQMSLGMHLFRQFEREADLPMDGRSQRKGRAHTRKVFANSTKGNLSVPRSATSGHRKTSYSSRVTSGISGGRRAGEGKKRKTWI